MKRPGLNFFSASGFERSKRTCGSHSVACRLCPAEISSLDQKMAKTAPQSGRSGLGDPHTDSCRTV